MGSNRLCQAVKHDGSQCQVAALAESNFCFFHDETKANERREAQALGGRQNRAKTLDKGASDVKIQDSGDVVALLSETINQVRKGALDPRVANSVGYLANIAIRVFDQRDLETRLRKMEELIEERSPITKLSIRGN